MDDNRLVNQGLEPLKGQITFDDEVIQKTMQMLSEKSSSFQKLAAQKILEEEQAEIESQKRAKKSPYIDFAQLNLSDYNTKELDKIMRDSPVAFRLLLVLIKFMDGYNACMASYAVLTKILEVSKPTLTRAINYLKTNKHIKVYKSGTSNVYAVNDDIAWKSWGKNLAYSAYRDESYIAEIKTNVVISSDEQEEPISEKTQKQKLTKVQIKQDKNNSSC